MAAGRGERARVRRTADPPRYPEAERRATELRRRLDEAAYGWPADLSDDDLLGRSLALNLERAG